MLTLYGNSLSTPSNVVQLTLNYLALPHQFQPIALAKGEQRSPAHLARHPAGKVPALDDNGFVLFESSAIIKYLAKKAQSSAYPNELKQQALVDQWLAFSAVHIYSAVTRVMFNQVVSPMMKLESDKRSAECGLQFLHRDLPILNAQLDKQAFICGDELSVADLSLAGFLQPLELIGIDSHDYPVLHQWRERLKKQTFFEPVEQAFQSLL